MLNPGRWSSRVEKGYDDETRRKNSRRRPWSMPSDSGEPGAAAASARSTEGEIKHGQHRYGWVDSCCAEWCRCRARVCLHRHAEPRRNDADPVVGRWGELDLDG